MNNLKKDINNNTLKNLYLFTGPEVFLSEFYTNDIRKKLVGEAADDFNLLTFSRVAPNIMASDSFINSYPFMSEKKLLIIKDSKILKKATDEEKKYWSKALAALPEYCVVIFCENEIDKRNAIYKAISANGSTVEFKYQTGQTLIIWIQKFISSHGKKISQEDAQYLIDSCNSGMINLKREMEKLICCKSENTTITRSDIDRLVTKSLESQSFELAEDILKGNTAAAFKKIEALKTLKVDISGILPAIFYKFSTYRKIKLLTGTMDAKRIASTVRQSEYFVKNDMATLSKISMERIEKLIYACKETDYKVKNGLSNLWTELLIMLTI